MNHKQPNLNENQKKAVFCDNPLVCLTASAGTGKTTVIVNRFMHILERERPELENIVALTFTKNAASEMRQRIRNAVEGKMSSADGAPDPYWHRLFRKMDFARISTFHAFYSDILRNFPLEAGIDPEFIILEEDKTEELILQELFKNLVIKLQKEQNNEFLCLTENIDIKQLQEKYIIPLYQSHRDKLHALYGFKEINPDSVPIADKDEIERFLKKLPWICVSDTEWISTEAELRILKRRLKREAESNPEDKERIYKVIQKINDVVSVSWDIRSGNDHIDPEDFITTINKASLKGRLNTGSETDSPINQTFILLDKLKEIITDIKPLIERKNSESDDSMKMFLGNLLSVYKKFEEAADTYKQENSILDFTDLSLKARKLLADNERALASVRSNIRHILVDEFQDTDRIQLDILLMLAGIDTPRQKGKFLHGKLSRDDSTPSLFVVGDEKQSIYKFRGADVSVFSDIKELFKKMHGEIINLDENFRSRGELIAFHNRLFPQFLPKTQTLNFEAAHKHAAASRKKGNARSVQFIFKEPEKKNPEARDLNKTVEDNLSYKISDEEDEKIEGFRRWEAVRIARKIKQIVDEKQIVIHEKEKTRDPAFGDIAILFNTMSDFSIYERELIANGIPYRTWKSEDFLFLPEILDIINLLWAVCQPYSDYHLASALRCPIFGINDETLLYLKPDEENRLWDNVRNPDNLRNLEAVQRERLSRSVKIIQELIECKDLYDIEDFVSHCVRRAEIREVYAGVSGYAERLTNIDQFINREVASMAAAGKTTLGELVREIERLMKTKYLVSKRPVESEDVYSREGGGSVLISTIHGSKGMEFPIVFIPNLGHKPRHEGNLRIDPDMGIAINFKEYDTKKYKFKNNDSHLYQVLKYLDDLKEEAEKKRLMYVAATRAKEFLVLSGANVASRDRLYIKMISSFLPGGRFHSNLPKRLGSIVRLEPDEESETVSDFSMDSQAAHPEPPDFSSVQINVNRIMPIALSLAAKRRFTPSELPDYVLCPRLYYYRFLARFPEPEERAETREFPMKGYEFGSFMHRMIEKYNGENPPDSEMDFPNVPDDKKSIVRKETLRLLENYRKTDICKSALAAEKVFKEQRFACSLGEYQIEGAMDMIMMNGDKIHVVDFKTDYIDESSIEWRAGHYYPQIHAYAAAASRLEENRNLSCSIVFLHPGIVHTIDFDQEKIEETEKFLCDIFQKIRQEKEWKRNPGACPCPYKELCKIDEPNRSADSFFKT